MSHRRRSTLWFVVALALAGVAGCYLSGDDLPPNPNEGSSLLPARVRRLTPQEYNATLADIHFASGTVGFPGDPVTNGYDNRASLLRVTAPLAEALWTNAPAVADEVTQAALKAPPCSTTDEPCARQILRAIAERAYRRPLETLELDELVAVFRVGLDGGTFASALSLAVQVIVQSADTLYRTELGTSDVGSSATLTPREVTQNLAYALTRSPPDAELAELGGNGDILRPEVRAAQARRLLKLPSARATLAAFAAQWLEIAGVSNLNKDSTVFPNWPNLRSAALAETKDFFAAAVVDQHASLGSLFTADWSVVNDAALASFYGVSPGAKVGLPAAERVGILTHASVLAKHSQARWDSPVQRGHFVRSRLLCQPVAPVPTTLKIDPVSDDPTLTARQRFANHSSNPTCAGCHDMMDPIGLGFESYDATGAFRATEQGKPVDARGRLTSTDIDGDFTGPRELATRLAQSRMARGCFVNNWMEYMMGDPFSGTTRAVIDRVLGSTAAPFVDGSATIDELIISLVQSDVFMTRGAQIR